MRHYFIFDDVKSSDYGVWISEGGTFGAASRDVEEIVVPGRDGNLTIDNGRFNAVEHVYPAYIAGDSKTRLMDLRNALLSKRGHQMLLDSLHDDEFYRAYYEKGLEPELTGNLRDASFEIMFTRDPRRFLISGDEPVNVPVATTETLTGAIVSFNEPGGVADVTISATPGATITYCGKNLFDKSAAEWKTGYLIDSTGTEISSTYYKYTEAYFRVKPSTLYSISIRKGTASNLAVSIPYYDDTKTFISRDVAISATTEKDTISGTFTTPATCAYIRINVPKTSTSEVQVEYGHATPYEAYVGTETEYTQDYSVSSLAGWNTVYADTGDVTLTLERPFGMVNPTLFESSPLIRVHDQGVLYLSNMSITVTGDLPYIDIDTEVGDCFYGATNANQYVTFSGYDYPTLKPGMNYFRYTGFSAVEVTPRWWRL